MRLARQLGVLSALGAAPVLSLVHAAARETWTQPISPMTALYFWGIISLPPIAGFLWLRNTRLGNDRAFSFTAWIFFVSTHWYAIRIGLVELVDLSAIGAVGLVLGAGLGLAFSIWAGLRVDKTGILVTILGVSFLAVQAFSLSRDISRLVEPEPAVPASSTSISPSTPSVWVILLDAHPSPSALRDFYDVDPDPEMARLVDLGFRVWDDARANYSHTTASVPSLLGGMIFDSTLDSAMPSLLAGLQGGTGLTHSFTDAGYSLRMSPAPWSRSSCGPLVVDCQDEGLDERLYFLLRLTPLADFFPERFGHPMPIGGRRVLESIADFDPSPKHFTFVHSTVSHVPFVLDEDCAVRPSREPLEAQFRCTQHLLIEALETIDLETDIVIVAADHGLNLLGQGNLEPENWTVRMARERFSTFLAISDPDDCTGKLPEQISNTQVLPLVLNCYGNDLAVPRSQYVGMEQGAWGRIIEYTYPWDGWSTEFDE